MDWASPGSRKMLSYCVSCQEQRREQLSSGTGHDQRQQIDICKASESMEILISINGASPLQPPQGDILSIPYPRKEGPTSVNIAHMVGRF